MSYKNANSYAILVAISVIALTLATEASFNHYYSASAASKRNTDSSSSDSSSASAAASTTNPKTLSKKELNSFISCINTANKSQGLTHKIVTNCLDTAKGITRSSVGGIAAGGSTTGSAAAAATAGEG
jgi:hypothetical protein